MRRFIPVGTALALAAAVLVAPTTASSATAPSAAATSYAAKPKAGKAKKPTPYAFRAHGYGTRIKGGDLPSVSGATALASLGCTNRTGIRKHNEVADVQLPGLGRISGVRTDISTVKTKTGVSSVSEHSVAQIVLAESSFGRLSIQGITSMATASAGRSGYSTDAETTLARLVFTPTGGEPRELRLPTLNRPIEVPGLLRVSIGDIRERKGADFAHARANGLKIALLPTQTRVVVGRTVAYMTRGIRTGLFNGSSAATRAELLAGNVRLGRTQSLTMPCQGTDGKVQTNAAAKVSIPGLLDLGAVSSRQMGKQGKRRALGFEEASVASLNLGDGALKVDAIMGRVRVVKAKGKKARVSYAGSTIGGITVDGERYSLPELDGIEIPGIAKVETLVKEKVKNGGRITALRLTLLDGTGAVVDLGQAYLKIRPSGR
ncbi:choice-of-anchor P family protein [Nocardioides dongkuii]|uniref:choice-of-anchor P family protein n=1 Tax=Nocardioides dongkuii TaxID=2760089 RepID=UPI0015FB6B10|nr:choice-of-anchor P family protein [Nocardioides dongkuii]